ncbi:MAG: undecaprenyl-diphosphate phosphatase, partial [Candidatus Doudnabacteria bacterium]|nr:undecaprenyl-diphosphate phosphatase [Candidatus Doudnabacteria bacterium]
TLVAVLVYFKNDIWLLIKGFWHSLFKSTRDLQNNIYQKLSWLLIIASVPGAIIGKLLEAKAETVFRSPVLVAGTLFVFGLIILFFDKFGKKEKNLDRITWLDSLFIGFSQALAVIPGVSRSGSTIAAGLSLKFKRADAARFSFLMSIPIIFGAGLVKIKHFHDGVTTPELAAGFLSATIFGFLAIKYLLRYLSSHDFKIFVWYRIGLAILILAVYFVRLGK